jgi:hypothetical protein
MSALEESRNIHKDKTLALLIIAVYVTDTKIRNYGCKGVVGDLRFRITEEVDDIVIYKYPEYRST